MQLVQRRGRLAAHQFFAFGHRDPGRLGLRDPEAVEQIDDIALFQSLRSSNPDARRHLWQRLGITVQRRSAALLIFAHHRPTQPTYVDSKNDNLPPSFVHLSLLGFLQVSFL